MARPIKNVTDNTVETTEPENVVIDKVRTKRTQVRTQESRTALDRAPLTFKIGSRFNVPEDVIEADPDSQYGYTVYSNNGEDCKATFDHSVELGWMPALKSEHPSLAKRSVTGLFANDREDDFVKTGGQILMKRPKETHQAELDFYKDQNKSHEVYRNTMKLFDESTRGPLRGPLRNF